MPKDLLTMKELQEEIGMSAPWLRRMERMNLIKPYTPKHQGAKRVYSKGDVINYLRLMALSICGFHPEEARRYAELVDSFNRLTEPFLKKARPRHIDGAVFLFDLRDIYPEGDPNNIEWNKLAKAIRRKDGIHKFKEYDPGELLKEAFDLLFEIAEVALRASIAVRKAKKALRLAEGIENDIRTQFLPGVRSPFYSPEEYGIEGVGEGLAFFLRSAFKDMEEKE